MNARAVTAASLRQCLERCGYTQSRLACDYRFDGHTAPLVGFFGKPWDARSACVAAIDSNGDSRAAAATCRTLGAPTVLVCRGDGLDCWRMAGDGPAESKPVATKEIEGFFRVHRDDLSPETIYAVKTRRATVAQRQLWFVDAGLMPAVERNAGEALHRLVEGAIQDLTTALGGKLRSRKAFEDLYKTVFWLLAAKLLHEKRVDKFKRIDLTDVDEVFRRVGRHYADIDDLPPGGEAWRPAIDHAAANIASWGHLGNISAEALGYLYERALIDKKPKGTRAKKLAKGRDIRKELGIHSTPPVLVDHMLAQVWPLIEQIAPADRHVFEPGCGHAAFLVAALRWLREYAGIPEGIERHRYLRDHLHGVEVEPFAGELGKLSLTLADVPYGNSWRTDADDMFLPNVLKSAAEQCTVLLANPPYEAFTRADKTRYRKAGEPVTAITKAVEMLKRTLPHLAPGGVFGVVVPQGVLHDQESRPVREFLLRECEFSEVAVFADNLFEQSDHEVAVLMGRRRKPAASHELMYRRVRERGMIAFKGRLAFSSERELPQARFVTAPSATLFLPDLPEVWDYLGDSLRLGVFVDVQQGFQFLNESELKGRSVVSESQRVGWVKAILRADQDYSIWALPKTKWIDASKRNFRRPGAATVLGTSQVVLNYAPVAREPWRLKAVVDEQGVAVSSRFLVFRPKATRVDLRVLWAFLNSPVANAYAYCFSGKRETLVKEWRAFPLPAVAPERLQAILSAADQYLTAAKAAEDAFMQPRNEEAVQRPLLALDAEVLRAYDLPPRLERQLLDLFQGVERKGVGCKFRGYYPSGLDAYVPLHELISEEYARSTLDAFRKHAPLEQSSPVLAALRSASEAFGEE